MNPKNPFRNEKVEGLITELRGAATRMERLIRELPTTDSAVLGELHSLSMRIDRMVSEDPGRERRSMLLDQARRKAMFQRQRYMKITHSGYLRNR
ncbi:hypothetical protein [Desulfoluna spongiiphila]|uniref:Protein FliT n=1 Tax=Desulfoluna spongiiphila TaxID=419481 RepID=A0A1G5E839_9BACT|nr:hypothetical protein [Desulfoluna spongiiphila]SCY22860.1 hypothetical protein SAMN05216233_105215 [Desulfoluna spongiiphila]